LPSNYVLRNSLAGLKAEVSYQDKFSAMLAKLASSHTCRNISLVSLSVCQRINLSIPFSISIPVMSPSLKQQQPVL
jgi:hypothetical protein